MALSWDARRDIPAQDRTFNQHERWDFDAAYHLKRYPLLLHVPYFTLYRKQVIKQADLVLALHWQGDRFTAEEKARAFAYYETLTVRDSSLSACTQAVIAAEVGQLELAHDYLAEAAFMDMHDIEGNAGDGLHIASLAGAWLALVAGLGGMRDHNGELSFRPQLPPRIAGLRFHVRWRDVLVHVAVTPDEATYTIEDGAHAEIELTHEGTAFTIRTGEPVTMPIKLVEPMTPRPTQPIGRAPRVASED
jgi:alpha,alpha-trehalose phosphorylase